MAYLPKISIITIVYNNVKDIEYTMQSVFEQTYSHIEYIIIDGQSTDGTVDLINRHRNKIKHFISEKDNGIYNAMNKGLYLATGEYVLFLNSGDALYSKETISNIVDKGHGADIIYGETVLVNERREELGLRRHAAPSKFDWTSFKYGMNICHQAIYIRRSITVPYDESYRLSADIDWVIRCAKNANSSTNINEIVARYLVGGLSQKRHLESLKERHEIFKKHYGTVQNIFNHAIIAIRLILYRIQNGRTAE